MRAKIVKIGNSRGVRLPKAILDASGLAEEVEIEVGKGRIVLAAPRRTPREGWAEDARRMVESGDDADPWEGAAGLDSWDDEGWTWPEDLAGPDESVASTSISPPSTRSKAPKSPRRAPAPSSPRTSSTKR